MAAKFTQLSSILKKLLFEKNMKPIDLAREIDVPQPTIHRLVTGKSTRPYKSSLQPIAKYFSLNIEQLLGEEPLPGDVPQDRNSLQSTNPSVKNIPLVPLKNVHDIDFKESYDTVPFIGQLDEKSFATILTDTSMEPVFSRNSILIIDPQKVANDRSYVLVQLNSTGVTVFRQLLIDADHMYLKALNTDLNELQMRRLDKDDKIIGTLIEARMNYNFENR